MFEFIDANCTDAGVIAGFAIAYILLLHWPDMRRSWLNKYRSRKDGW